MLPIHRAAHPDHSVPPINPTARLNTWHRRKGPKTKSGRRGTTGKINKTASCDGCVWTQPDVSAAINKCGSRHKGGTWARGRVLPPAANSSAFFLSFFLSFFLTLSFFLSFFLFFYPLFSRFLSRRLLGTFFMLPPMQTPSWVFLCPLNPWEKSIMDRCGQFIVSIYCQGRFQRTLLLLIAGRGRGLKCSAWHTKCKQNNVIQWIPFFSPSSLRFFPFTLYPPLSPSPLSEWE